MRSDGAAARHTSGSSLGLLSAGLAQTDPAPPTPPPDTSPLKQPQTQRRTADTVNLDANLPSFELKRDDRPITVQQTATDAEGRHFSCRKVGATCRKDENLSFYYAPNPKRIDTKVDNTRIRSSIVLRTQPKEGGADAQDKAVLSFFGGSLGRNEETLCPQNLKREKSEKVTILARGAPPPRVASLTLRKQSRRRRDGRPRRHSSAAPRATPRRSQRHLHGCRLTLTTTRRC